MASPRRSILCVEDDDDTCLMLTTLLGQQGYEVQSARTATEALRLAANEAFDLYLLDTELPDRSGVELCRELRERDARTPIVFYTGAAFPADRERGMEAGAQAYLLKPEVDSIVETVERLTTPEGSRRGD